MAQLKVNIKELVEKLLIKGEITLKNKLFAFAIFISIFTLLLAGCNSDPVDNTDSNIDNADGKQEISVLSTWEISDVRPPKDQTLVGQWLEEELEMDLVLETIPVEGINTKINTLISSNSLPTLLLKVNEAGDINEINSVGAKGAFLNITEHLDKVPNYAKLLEDEFIKKEMSDADGNIYGFAKVYSDENIMYSTPIIRQDLLEGSPYTNSSIETIEDLTEALKYLTDKIGSSAWIQRDGYEGLIKQSGLLWNLSNKTFYDYEQDRFTHPILAARTKDYIQWLKKLRAEDIIHADWAIMTDETWEGLLASNKGAFTIDRMSIIGDSNFSEEYNWLPVDYPKINGNAFLQPNQSKVLPSTSWVINANASQQEIDKALEFVDFLYDEENHKTLTLGFEGETYTTEDPNTMAGIQWLVQIYGQNADNPDADMIFSHGIQSFTRLQTPLDMQSFPGTYPEIMYEQIERIKNDLGGFRPPSPTISFTPEIEEMLTSSENALNTYFDTNIVKFIEGDRSLDEWDDFVEEVKDMNMQEIVDAYNDAYDVY